jgi:hypothetical protein
MGLNIPQKIFLWVSIVLTVSLTELSHRQFPMTIALGMVGHKLRALKRKFPWNFSRFWIYPKKRPLDEAVGGKRVSQMMTQEHKEEPC